jgi:hypothetical protein
MQDQDHPIQFSKEGNYMVCRRSASSSRLPRLPGGSGQPWRKRNTRPVTETGWTVNLGGGMPWVPIEHRLESFRRSVMDTADGAALIEAVRHCEEYGEKVPQWIVGELELWLAEFVAMTTPSKRPLRVRKPRFGVWGRAYWKALSDWIIAHHCEDNLRAYGLTWHEACDEASCHFRGTELARTPDAIRKAWQRARRRGHRDGWFQRVPTSFESRILFPLLDPVVHAGSPRSYWNIVNDDRRGDRRGEWRERPRLLAALSPVELEREARSVIEHWRSRRVGTKRGTNRPHT